MPKGLFRTALYVPCSNSRAMAKSVTLPVDVLIYDLEDSVAPDRKDEARQSLLNFLGDKSKTDQYLVVRVNGVKTEWAQNDLKAISRSHAHAVMLPKVEKPEDVTRSATFMKTHNVNKNFPIWANIETPAGVLGVDQIVTNRNLEALVVGTNDLCGALHIERTLDRSGLMYSLQRILLSARANNLLALDGTFIDLNDPQGLAIEARHGKNLGFDGKTIIHPSQIDVVNIAFSPSDADITRAQHIIRDYEIAQSKGEAVIVVDGRMVEALHYEQAKEVMHKVALIHGHTSTPAPTGKW